MSTPTLFSHPEPAGREVLALSLASLAGRRIYFGTSSWKYQGWMGQIYTAERYFTRGRFSQKKFDETCLAEYAEVFPAVCGDFSFYQFPSDDYWRKLFTGAPSALLFAFKVPEMITVRTWPGHARYGARAGQENESFLDAGLLERVFLRPLAPYREQVAALIFEFGTFPKKTYPGPAEFLGDLDRFLRGLPGGWRYSVEIRNPEYLGPEYFGCLRERNVAHVFNAWTRMPPLEAQVEIPGAWTADFTVTRALLRRGRSYEAAVKTFEPYSHVQDENPEAREAIRAIVRRSLAARQGAFVFVNNRLEGNAPATIAGVVEGLSAEG